MTSLAAACEPRDVHDSFFTLSFYSSLVLDMALRLRDEMSFSSLTTHRIASLCFFGSGFHLDFLSVIDHTRNRSMFCLLSFSFVCFVFAVIVDCPASSKSMHVLDMTG
jgi:magnesium-transporting ATPase (P-type)